MVALLRRISFIVACLVALVIFSVFVSAQDKQDKAGSNPSLRIGFSLDTLKTERWQTDRDEFQKRAQALGAEVLIENADGDDDTQFQQCQKLIDAGIKVLVLISHNTDSAARIVSAAKAKHVSVLSYDRLVRNSDVDLYVGFDNFAIGLLQASALTQRVPKGNYILVGGSPSDFNAKLLREGQMSVLQPLIDKGDVKIVANTWSTNWDPAEAYVNTAQAIDASNGDIVAVVASSDGTAGGAIQALQEHKLAGKVLVSGQDADLAAIVRILLGTQTMTVYKPIAREAQRAAEEAVKLAKGEPIETTRSLDNGAKKVPAILLDSIVVTKDNVKQTVIKDGFQKLELIRQGLPKNKRNLLD